MTGRELYEKWADLAGDEFDCGETFPRAHWFDLDFEESRAWDALAAHLQSPQPEEARA